MNRHLISTLLLLITLLIASCQSNHNKTSSLENSNPSSADTEKKAILTTLNEETQAALSRNYDEWKDKWIHESYVYKTYLNFADSSMSESLGWDQINDFVRNYIVEHPEPAPLPSPLEDIDIRLYDNGAWVEYEQMDPSMGLKRERRLMEKENGQWKIAGMQTIIYGPDVEKKNL